MLAAKQLVSKHITLVALCACTTGTVWTFINKRCLVLTRGFATASSLPLHCTRPEGQLIHERESHRSVVEVHNTWSMVFEAPSDTAASDCTYSHTTKASDVKLLKTIHATSNLLGQQMLDTNFQQLALTQIDGRCRCHIARSGVHHPTLVVLQYITCTQAVE